MAKYFDNPENAKKASDKKTPRGPGQFTKTVKETVLAAFEDLQKDPVVNIIAWGKGNPTEFYKIAAKLIPTEVTGAGGGALFPPQINRPPLESGNSGEPVSG
jgi:hypothetical protein